MNLLPKYTVTRTENEAWENIDTTKGEYLSATKYWEEEGGSEYDFEATAKALQKCVTMGPHWIRYNSMTERYDFLRLLKGWREEFEKCWTICKAHQSNKIEARNATSNAASETTKEIVTPFTTQAKSAGDRTTETHNTKKIESGTGYKHQQQYN